MIILVISLCCFVSSVRPEQDEHREFQYKSVVDGRGLYNFAYDTGNDNSIAHSMRMEHKDPDGVVRGRYGYTDPRGRMRMVEYEAGPDGFKARGDIGPDYSEHSETPGSAILTEDQIAGWEQPPEFPMAEPLSEAAYPLPEGYPDIVYYQREINIPSEKVVNKSPEPKTSKSDIYEITNVKSDPINIDNKGKSSEIAVDANAKKLAISKKSEPLTIHNIDVHPDEIRVASKVKRTAKDIQSESSSIEIVSPVSDQNAAASGVVVTRKFPQRWPHDRVAEVRYPHRWTHDHAAEFKHDYTQAHNHAAEKSGRQTHDHAAEIKAARKTHDHDAEVRSLRLTHDHASEAKHDHASGYKHDHASEYKHDHASEAKHDHASEAKHDHGHPHNHSAEVVYPIRKTHDHAAEVKHSAKHNHDHSAELRNVKGSYVDYSEYYAPSRVYYRDDHDPKPHRHLAPLRVYRNDRDHRHSDVHLYGDTGKYYSGTVRPQHLRYIPADKYHNKYYYWT